MQNPSPASAQQPVTAGKAHTKPGPTQALPSPPCTVWQHHPCSGILPWDPAACSQKKTGAQLILCSNPFQGGQGTQLSSSSRTGLSLLTCLTNS